MSYEDNQRSGGYGDSSGTGGGLGKDDTYGSAGNTGGGSYGRDDQQGLGSGDNYSGDTHDRSDNYGGSGTSGGLGADDTYGRSTETGGRSTGYDAEQGMGSGRTDQQARGGYGEADDTLGSTGRGGVSDYTSSGDRDTSGRTGGGLGADDTYGDKSKTGGDTGETYGRTDEYGMGSGRTVHQEEGGVGGELGEDRGTSTRQSGRGDNSGKGNDSTMGKLMEKAGSAFNNENLEQKGRAKREEASDNY